MKYPDLRGRLRAVYAATKPEFHEQIMEVREQTQIAHRGRLFNERTLHSFGQRDRPWTPDIGFSHGIAALNANADHLSEALDELYKVFTDQSPQKPVNQE